jgi:hypothetical protein
MIIQADFSSLKSTKPHEYAIRFLFGGLLTAAAGFIAKRYGPGIGGLFLAFPAIFPASATLIEKHQLQKKRKVGHDGTNRGRIAAGIDAAGTFMGALALILFAFILFRYLPSHNPALTLTAAALAWLTFSTLLWLLLKRAHRRSS